MNKIAYRPLVFLTLCLLSLSSPAWAQTPRYLSAMQKNKALLDTARTPATLQTVANNLERIAAVENKEWLPGYYLAYCYSLIGFADTDMNRKDELYSKATAFINKSDSLKPNDSEIYAMKAMVMQMQIQVNPMMRGQVYGPASVAALDKAIELNPQNPRPYLLKGQALYYMPPMFGGGKDKALPLLQQAVEKFGTFRPENDLMPTWGVERAKQLLEECSK
jgi:tetratricopeptide (TPR) repeat protein